MTRRILVTGVVQGVGYRAWTLAQAQSRGLTGLVRNLSDGRVEAIVSGSQDAINSIIQAMWKGPTCAVVSKVEVSEADGAFQSFTIER